MSGAGETDAGGAVSASVLGGSGMSVASSGVASGTMVSNSVLLVSGTASGTLTVSGGGNVANITLLGQYVVGQFTSASDGHGGTVIGDPPVMADTQSGTLTSPLA